MAHSFLMKAQIFTRAKFSSGHVTFARATFWNCGIEFIRAVFYDDENFYGIDWVYFSDVAFNEHKPKAPKKRMPASASLKRILEITTLFSVH